MATAAKLKLDVPLRLWSSRYLMIWAAAWMAFQRTPFSSATTTVALAQVGGNT